MDNYKKCNFWHLKKILSPVHLHPKADKWDYLRSPIMKKKFVSCFDIGEVPRSLWKWNWNWLYFLPFIFTFEQGDYILSLHAAKVKPRGHTGHGVRNLTRQSDTETINTLFESTKPQLLGRRRLWYYSKGNMPPWCFATRVRCTILHTIAYKLISMSS